MDGILSISLLVILISELIMAAVESSYPPSSIDLFIFFTVSLV